MPFDLSTIDRARTTFLPRRGSLVLDGVEGTIIVVDSGCLWVTLERDPRDIVLVKGMRFEIDRSGRTVIAAEEDSRLRLILAPTLAQRVVDALDLAFKKALARSIGAFGRRAACRSVPYF